MYLAHNVAARRDYWGLFGTTEVSGPDWSRSSETQILEHMIEQVIQASNPQMLLRMGAAYVSFFFFKLLLDYYLTSTAGIDWMTGQMIVFRKAEQLRSEDAAKSDEDRVYEERMDQLVIMDEVSSRFG